jgi:hypothetical protein
VHVPRPHLPETQRNGNGNSRPIAEG